MFLSNLCSKEKVPGLRKVEMAAPAPSPLASSAEKTNAAKLSRLLIDGGTTVLRNVFSHYHAPTGLATNLNSHFKTPRTLLRKRILKQPQWEKLFPPSGAALDPRLFDITLLFLLFTEICGLPPPSSGWNSKPHSSDNSFEANLARIKFYRNELYGHVTSTSVNESTFSSLWREISSVLIALGLDMAAIDKLKDEQCGEEDYINALLDWADSEEDTKSLLGKPQLMLQSLAFHLTRTLPEYKETLVEQSSRNLGGELNGMGVEELFALLFKKSLNAVKDPGRNTLMVVDGLDESEYRARNELLDVISRHFSYREPLPVAFVSKILEPGKKSPATLRKVNKAISCISTLLPIHENRLHFVHKSVKDWLTKTSLYGRHEFTLDDKEGHEILFDLCNAELDSIKGRGLLNSQFGVTEQYALQHGVQHMIELSGFGDGTTNFISDNLQRIEWIRPSLIERVYDALACDSGILDDQGAYCGRSADVFTFHRSVVFDPTGQYVLTGCLRNVYTLNGEYRKLSTTFDCQFSYCAFPKDKKKILRDCCHNPKKLLLWSMEDGKELKENILVYGFLLFMLQDIGYSPYAWIRGDEPVYKLLPIPTQNLLPFSASVPSLIEGDGYFHLWPIESRTWMLTDLNSQNLRISLVGEVRGVFPNLSAGFYTKVNEETALVGSPSYKYIATVNIRHQRRESINSSIPVVKEVVFSPEGNTLDSVCTDDRATDITVFRLLNQVILKRKSFFSPSLSLLPVQMGIEVCLENEIPELWNFELSKCVQPLTKLNGAGKFLCLSRELIACQRKCPSLAQEEWKNSFCYSSEKNSHQSRVFQQTWRSLSLITCSDLRYSRNCIQNEKFRNSNNKDIPSAIVSHPYERRQRNVISYSDSNTSHCSVGLELLVLDVMNVYESEFRPPVTAWGPGDRFTHSVSFNSRAQVLVCTYETIPLEHTLWDDELVTVTFWNYGSIVWKRNTVWRDQFIRPQFLFSPRDDTVAAWKFFEEGFGLYILNADTGKTINTFLKDRCDISDCKFVDDESILVCCDQDTFLRLFSVRSGNLVIVLDIGERPVCLGACVDSSLVAVGVENRMKFLRVWLPELKEATKKKGKKWLNENLFGVVCVYFTLEMHHVGR
ncbi:E3 ubiquitin-protein ligase DZIP3 [Stylophora pistillata]|uniref:E3 ubiquitin-protein ligase DZIP3 n=1 Tax=Stylophora pistillata TaxID=50429 RepID=A0A2B4S098_STYPI|nr:E3 ubiquitin-protein ligase DZIP3 [Stylophora pistillata]